MILFSLDKLQPQNLSTKRHTTVLTVALCISIMSYAISQSCLPTGILFSSQAQLDSFQSQYPNCSQILGNVEITGEDIYDLHGLNVLTAVVGDLEIYGTSLTDLSGLGNLETIGGDFAIGSNYLSIGNVKLVSLAGIENLDSVGGTLWIASNDSLTSLYALHGLKIAEGGLSIGGNDGLTNLQGLNNVTTLGRLFIGVNKGLRTLSGLNNLSTIVGDFNLQFNHALANLDALQSLESVGGDLHIVYNDKIVDLTGLQNLRSIGERFWVRSNPSLVSLTGIDSVEFELANRVIVFDNPLLTTCNVRSICKLLSEPQASITIAYNSQGCDNNEQVNSLCSTLSIHDHYKADLLIYPNPATGILQIHSSLLNMPQTVIMYNTLGQQIFYQKVSQSTVDVSGLPRGYYIVEITSVGHRILVKILLD